MDVLLGCGQKTGAIIIEVLIIIVFIVLYLSYNIMLSDSTLVAGGIDSNTGLTHAIIGFIVHDPARQQS